MPITADSSSVTITHPDSPQSSVKILHYGATVVSWKVKGDEKLWLSESSKLDGSRAVRGGIPLVFPRFGPPGSHPATDKLPQHGFARSSIWEFLGEVNPTTVQFGLGPENLDADTKSAWDYDFSVIATVELASPSQLNVSISVENTDRKPFDFNVLFHTYYKVPEVEKVSLEGFTELKYYNKVKDSNDESGLQPITIHEEFDRVYRSTPDVAVIKFDQKPLYTVENSKSLTDTVVWNPWTVTAEKMTDFAPKQGFHHMICVENGNVAGFTTLKPEEKWEGSIAIKSHI